MCLAHRSRGGSLNDTIPIAKLLPACTETSRRNLTQPHDPRSPHAVSHPPAPPGGTLSDMLLESHTQEYTCRNICYERNLTVEKRIDPSIVQELFGEFADKDKYNGAVPTGRYLAHVRQLHHELISDHLSKEVKKQGENTLHWDVSYKEPTHLCQYQCQSIFQRDCYSNE